MPKTLALVALAARIWRTSTNIGRSSRIRTFYLCRENVSAGAICCGSLLTSAVSFVHITDPYANDNPSDSHAHSMSMQQTPPLPHLPQDQSYGPDYTLAGIEEHVQVEPQYVDVAASSLKAMIDPNLEANTQVSMGDGHDPPEQSGYVNSGSENHQHELLVNAPTDGQYLKHEDAIQEENINETIMKALQNTNEQVKSM